MSKHLKTKYTGWSDGSVIKNKDYVIKFDAQQPNILTAILIPVWGIYHTPLASIDNACMWCTDIKQFF